MKERNKTFKQQRKRLCVGKEIETAKEKKNKK